MQSNSLDEKYAQMTGAPVEKLICRLAVPTIISMLITTIYNMADTFFIGKINTSASGAVGIAFSVMAVIQAVGFFFGQGAGNNISRALGRKDTKQAQTLASVGFFSALFFGALIMIFGLIFLEPMVMALGSTKTIRPYAISYLRIILLGSTFMTASFVLNNLLRFQGNAFYGMIGLASGGILNIILDPIFIFVFEMGIAGAALATILSQFVSFCILLYQCNHAGVVKISIKKVHLSWDICKMIAGGGTPSLCRQGIASIAAICLNTAARPFGDAAIAAMSIVTRIANFTLSAVIGFGQGFQPVCGYSYGAKKFDRVRRGFWFCTKFATIFLIVFSAAEFIFAPQLVAQFRKDDAEVILIGAKALRMQCVTGCLSGFFMLTNMTLQTTGQVVPASILGMAKQGIFLIPAVKLLPPILDVLGLQLAQPISDVLSFLLSIPFLIVFMNKMPRQNHLESKEEGRLWQS